jgi:hypothetical protein
MNGGKQVSEYSLEVDREELGVIVEALRIQRETWNDALMKKIADDESVSAIQLSTIQKALAIHDELLKRLPDKGMTF